MSAHVHSWERATPVAHHAHERHWSGALPAKSCSPYIRLFKSVTFRNRYITAILAGRALQQRPDRIDRIARGLLRHIVADHWKNAAFVEAGELFRRRIVRARDRAHAVGLAIEIDRRHADRGLGLDARLDVHERRIARRVTEAVTIGLDHNVDIVGIIEGGRGLVEGGIPEVPVGRPQLPQYFGDVAAIPGEAGAATLGVEIVLVPEAMLLRGGDRLHRALDVLDVVADAA